MEIHYVWVYNYRKLKEAGINLSAKLIFEMERDPAGERHYRLKISDNPEYIPNFFGKKNVSNVTAIIGKNGSGKTTILNYIKSHLPDGLEANMQNDLVIYSTEDENESQQYYIIKPHWMELNLQKNTPIKFTIKSYGDDVITSFRFIADLANVEFIYYSYLLNFEEDQSSWHGLTNISTAYLMMEARRKISEENLHEPTRSELLSKCNDLDNLNISEVARAIQFLMSNPSLPFDAPEFLNIEIDLTEINFFTNPGSQFPHVSEVKNKNYKQ